MIRTLTKIAVVGALSLSLASCILPAQPTENPAPGVNRPSSSAEPETPVNPSFGDSYEWSDGMTLTVSTPRPYEPSESAYLEPAAAYLAFDMTVVNGSDANFDPFMIYITAQSANVEAAQVFDSANGITGTPETTILPGREATFTVVFGVEDPSDIVMEISIGFEYRSVIFTT